MSSTPATIDDLTEWQIQRVSLAQQICDAVDSDVLAAPLRYRKAAIEKMIDEVKRTPNDYIPNQPIGSFRVESKGEFEISHSVNILHQLVQIKTLLQKGTGT